MVSTVSVVPLGLLRMKDFQIWTASQSIRLQEPSQLQSARLTRMHECSSSLESPVFSQNRMPSGSCYVKESGDDRCISHGLGGGVQI